MRYLPVIVDEFGKQYENVTYVSLANAVDALEEFKSIFSSTHDAKIANAYVLNIKTGKHIIP